jgi:hypothetical protein
VESGVAVLAVLPPDDLPVGEGRHTIFSARYRLTIKGPDRGKWELAVEAEADAPLVTVDRVVRGVQQRAGDAGEPERLEGDELRALLGIASPAPSPDVAGSDEPAPACPPAT